MHGQQNIKEKNTVVCVH